MNYKKTKYGSIETVRSELIKKSKHGSNLDIKNLFDVYLDNNKRYSVLAKEPLLKTKTDIVPYILELIPTYREKNLEAWHKLIILGLRKRPAFFLEDLINECTITENDISLNRNLKNIDWNEKEVCYAAIYLMDKITPFPALILQQAAQSDYKELFVNAVATQIRNGNCQLSYIRLLSDNINLLKSEDIQTQVIEIVTQQFENNYIKFIEFLDFNTSAGSSYLNGINDLVKIHSALSTNVIGIQEDQTDQFSTNVILIWKIINKIDLEDDELDALEEYLNTLRDREFYSLEGEAIGCPKSVVQFLQCLDEEMCLDVMTSIYDSPTRRSSYLEEVMLSMHSERIYRDWIAEILETSDFSKRHKTAKKLLIYYPENSEEILYIVDSVGIEKYYNNVINIATELNIDTSKINRRNYLLDIDQDHSAGLSVYARCINNNDSIEELLYSLVKRNIQLENLKSKSFNQKVLASIGQVLRCTPELLVQNNVETFKVFLEWMKYMPKNGWRVTGEINETTHEVITQIQVPRNADETLVIESKSDLSDSLISTRSLSCYLLYKDIAFTEAMHVLNIDAFQCIDKYCEQNAKYRYLMDDIKRIASKKAANYILDLTKTKAISWKKDDLVYKSSLGEEDYSYIPYYKDDVGLLQIRIENRITYSFFDKGNDTKLKREIAGIVPEKISEEPKIHVIGVADFLVRSTHFSCTNNDHELVRVKALVSVMTGSTIKEITIDAAYCPECNKYYILEREYLRLKVYGQICCKVVEAYELVKSGLTFNAWAEKSLLRIYGYNVNKNENLSKKERQRILSFVLENGIMTSYEIINHLEWQITTREGRPSMQDAISKWEDDLQYVRNYQYVNSTVRVRTIFVKHKIKRY